MREAQALLMVRFGRMCVTAMLMVVAVVFSGCRVSDAEKTARHTPPENLEDLLPWAYEKLVAPPAGSVAGAGDKAFAQEPSQRDSDRSPNPPLRLLPLLDRAQADCSWKAPSETRGVRRIAEGGSWSSPGRDTKAELLKIEGREYRCLTVGGFSFQGRDVGEIRLRADFGQAREFILVWSTPGKLAVPCSRGDGMVNRKISTEALSDWDRRITYLLLGVPAGEEDDIRLDWIDVAPGQSAYPDEVGSRRLRRGRELREVIYAHSPATIVFADLPLPVGGRLETGLSYDGGTGIRLQVALRGNGREEVLIDRELSDPGGWVNVTVDLGEWAGRRADVVLRAVGGTGSVGCWSNPQFYVAQPSPRRVLFYLIDTLGADHMGLYGYDRDTTPNLGALAAQGTWFANAFSNASRTIESVPNFMVSAHTVSHGIQNEFASVPAALGLLAEDFQRAGYATACFSTNVNVGPRQHLDRGFDSFFDYFGYMRGPKDSRTIPIEEVIEWCEDHHDRPTFLYVHTAEPHSPYEPPAPFDRRFDPDYTGRITGSHADKEHGFMTATSPRDIAHVVALYDGEVAFADHQFGRFVSRLQELGLDEGLITLVTSDHGEEFLEHGNWKHGRDLHGELVRVPLIISGPSDLVPTRRVEAPVQLLDVRPTLLDLCGIEPVSSLGGDSLRPLMAGKESERFRKRSILISTYQPFPAHHALIRMPYKIMFAERSRDPRDSFRLFDIEDDPEERIDLLESHKALASEMIRELVRVRDGLPRYSVAEDQEYILEIDREQIEQLRALGYL